MNCIVDPGSFRDPSGIVYERGSLLYRQVEQGYRAKYDLLMGSGLYAALVKVGLLVSHTESSISEGLTKDAYRVLAPERLPFISYPYEWCFGQLRDAALATLAIQKQALEFGMSLKDASAYNIQFRNCRPVLIDTLSFEEYRPGQPWTAYKQFCQHFLAPLALMSRTDIRLAQLLRSNIDGIPLDLASRLLPRSTYLSPGLLMHIHLHGAAQKKYADQPVGGAVNPAGVSKTATLGLIDSLEGCIRKLKWKPAGTTWAEYYRETNYSDRAMDGKLELVSKMLTAIDPPPKTAWDLGANTGRFSRLASARGIHTVAWDIDPAAVEKNYIVCRTADENNLLPLIEDLVNPSPDLGWGLEERRSVTRRGPVDVLFALALVHHLAIANNVPISRIARFFSMIGKWLIVEFVPKSDSQVKRLLASREDIFTDYTRDLFERDFAPYFDVVESTKVPDSERTLYLMKRI